MSERVFYCDDQGQLWWRDWCRGSDWMARAWMENQAAVFELSEAYCPSLAAECRQALADYDAFGEARVADRLSETLQWSKQP